MNNQTKTVNPVERLRYHVTGAIERGEAKPIEEVTGEGNAPRRLELAQIKRDYYRKESQHFARELKALLKVTKQAFDEACNDNKDQSLIDALDTAIIRAEAAL